MISTYSLPAKDSNLASLLQRQVSYQIDDRAIGSLTLDLNQLTPLMSTGRPTG